MKPFAASIHLTLPAIVFAVVGPVRAEEITFVFEGHITDVQDRLGILDGAIPVGTPFRGSYTFDAESPESLPNDPREGFYPGALVGFRLQIAGHQLQRTVSANEIRVRNGLDRDVYFVQDRSRGSSPAPSMPRWPSRTRMVHCSRMTACRACLQISPFWRSASLPWLMEATLPPSSCRARSKTWPPARRYAPRPRRGVVVNSVPESHAA